MRMGLARFGRSSQIGPIRLDTLSKAMTGVGTLSLA
jgi:hypothetical protein